MLENRVLKSIQKELSDTFQYNWAIDTLYAFNIERSNNKHSSQIWNTTSTLKDYYRTKYDRGVTSMAITAHLKEEPNHHKNEYIEYLRTWNTYNFKQIFEAGSIYYVDNLFSNKDGDEPCCFSRIIIQDGKVIDIQVLYINLMKWIVRENKDGVIYD